MKKLKKITAEELKSKIVEKDYNNTVRMRESYYLVETVKQPENKDVDELVDVEVALRQCKRVGVFN